MTPKVVKKETTKKSTSTAKAKPKTVKKAAPVKKATTTSASRKMIEVRTAKSVRPTKGTIDLRQEALVEELPVEKKIEVQSSAEHAAKASKVAQAIERLSGRTTEVATEEVAPIVQVREYDLDEKINFKNLHGRTFNIYRKISVSFVILTALLLAAILYFSLVKVNIGIVLNKEELKGSTILNISSTAASTTNSIVGVVKEVEVTESQDVMTTGVQTLGQDVSGKVKLINNYVRNQPLVASTRLLTADNQLLRVKNTVNIPAGGSVEAEVYSDQASSTVDVPAGTRLNIPGLWPGIQDKIYAETIDEVKYKEITKHTVTQADLDSAIEMIKRAVSQKAENEIVPTYKTQYSKVLYKIDDASLTTKTSARLGDEKDKFTVDAKVNVVVVAFSDEEAKKIAETQLNASIPGGKTLVSFNDSLNYELGVYDLVAGTAAVNVNYSGTAIAKNDSIIEKSRLVGLTADQLKNYLSSLPEVASYEIKFTPGFIGKVPNWTDRITISITK